MTAAVLFDIDGTLVDSTYHHAVAWHRAFSRITGDEVPPMWRLHRAIGMGGDRLVTAVAGEQVEERHGDDLRDTWREEYVEIRAEVRPLPGAEKLVHQLADDGFVIALASSGDPEFSREAVDLLGIEPVIATLLTSDDVDSSKPDPDLIEQTLGRLDDVDRAVFVGDTVYDIESAARAGIGCVAVRTGGFGRAELEEAGALRIEDGITDLLDIDWRRQLSSYSA
jgi:HAD superfamily hydrolase (TIGR01549 family)